jgi:capsular polysaccharide biosynthesis protein
LQPLVCLENNVVMTPDREVVSESINMPGRTHHGLKRAALCRDKVTPISGYATLLRGPSKGYYHAQIDNIPRIALLHAAPYRDLPEIKLLRPSNGPVVNTEIEDYLVPRIAPSNCRIVDLPPDTLYQVEKYLFSSFPGHVYAPHLPTLYHTRIRDEVLPDRPGRRENRIYVSRSKAGRRRIINEDALMEKLHTLGFKRHHLEDYHIKDKIELFYDAEMVVSPNGAGLATLLYTSDIDVLEILPFRKVLINEYFLSRAVGNRHRFILGDGSSVHDDFHVDAERVAEVASDMLAATGAPPLYADAN